MFTGIITDTTNVLSHHKKDGGLTITFEKPAGWDDLQIGESVSTDGVCLTVAKIGANSYDCHLVPETIAKSVFGLRIPAKVNLERSLQVSDRFGGHFVQGHVDGIGKVTKITDIDGRRIQIEFDTRQKNLVIQKGSITVNGVALTVVDVSENSFSVALIPLTLEQTMLGTLKEGDWVNIEFDIVGRYIAKIVESRKQDATR